MFCELCGCIVSIVQQPTQPPVHDKESTLVKEAIDAMDFVEDIVPAINPTRDVSNSDDATKSKTPLDQEQIRLKVHFPPEISLINNQ